MNIKQPVARFIKAVVAVTCIAPALTCCSFIYEWPEAETFSPNLRLYIDVPATKASMDDEPGAYNPGDGYNHEGADNMLLPGDMLLSGDLSVAFYEEDGSFVSAVSGYENIRLKPESYDKVNRFHRYIVELRAENLINGHSYRVVLLANRRSGYSAGILPFAGPEQLAFKKPDGVSGTDEEYLYSQLLLSGTKPSDQYGLGLRDYTMLNLSGADEARVPMWGVKEMPVKISIDPDSPVDFSGEICLLRSIAKVKVSLSAELQTYAQITDYDSAVAGSGMVLNYSRNSGNMVPAYSAVKSLVATESLAEASYKNTTSGTGTFTAPFYKDTDGSFYTYLPEQEIGEAYISMQFRITDPSYVDVDLTKTLQFADYVTATTEVLGGKNIPLTDEQLAPYRFPVLRNHYYVYVITKLNPLELKFEICNWSERTAPDIIFN